MFKVGMPNTTFKGNAFVGSVVLIVALGCFSGSVLGRDGDVAVESMEISRLKSVDVQYSANGNALEVRARGSTGEWPTLEALPFRLGEVSYARDIFVSPVGNDESGSGEAASPLRTLNAAAKIATPGTRIVLRQGAYPIQGSLKNLYGEPGRPIVITGEGGVVFDAQGGEVAMHISAPRHLVLQNFSVINTSVHGINIDDGGSYDTPATSILIRNVTFRNIGTGNNNDCLKLSGVDKFVVTESQFFDCDHGEAIDMVGCRNGVISGNLIEDLPRNGINTKGGTADILIHGNRFVNIRMRAVNAGGSTGLRFFRPPNAPYEGARIRVIANVFEDVGERDGAVIAFVGCDTCVFANNTIIRPKSHVVKILQESTQERFVPSRRGFFINNIVVFNSSEIKRYVKIGPGTAPASFVFSNNLWYSLDDPTFSGPEISAQIPREQKSIVQQGPGFELNGSEYIIPKGSPAAGAGTAVPGGLDLDFLGRPYKHPPDLGAFVSR